MEQKEDAVEQKGSEENQTIEETKNEQKGKDSASMESLLSEEGLGLDFPSQGEIRKGLIATIRENEVLVSIGTKSEGIISGREFEQIPEEERSAFEIGQEIPVYVVAPEDQNGNVILSYTRAREEQDWVFVAQMRENGESYQSTVIGYNKGGLIVPIGRLRGFVPASQVSVLRRLTFTGETPEQRWGTLVGEPIEVSVIEMDRERRRLILSERVALNETRESLKDRLLDELEEGIVRTGRVTSLADFGAFVNIEGADGLVHLSEISWDRIQHPSEVLEIGQEVEVKVISVDHDRKRIGLSIRQLQDDPWVKKVSHLRDGSLVEGTITHLTKFGAFARIGEDLEGLIHVSEISEQRIAHPKEVLHEGDVVTLRVIRIDTDRRRIGLSLRKVDSPAYADLDWKIALAEEVDKAQGEPAEAEVEDELEPLAEMEAAVEEKVEEVAEDEQVETEADAVEPEIEDELEAVPEPEQASQEPSEEEPEDSLEEPAEREEESETEEPEPPAESEEIDEKDRQDDEDQQEGEKIDDEVEEGPTVEEPEESLEETVVNEAETEAGEPDTPEQSDEIDEAESDSEDKEEETETTAEEEKEEQEDQEAEKE